MSQPTRSSGVLAKRLGRSSGFGLPEELLVAALGRVRLVLAITLFGAILSFAIRSFRAAGVPEGFVRERIGIYYVAVAGVAAAVVLGLTYLRSATPQFALKLCLAFEVFIGYVIAIGHAGQEVVRSGHLPHVTWTAPLMIAFPLIVPSPPRVTLFVAMATGSSSFAAVFILTRLGLVQPDPSHYVASAFSPILASAVAYFGSKVVYGLNVEYARAKRLGSYELVSKLGSGGMGEVWKAKHRLLVRPAAVKLIRSETLGKLEAGADVLLERFEREVQATALLTSPHTIGVYDFGVAEDGSFFYVMELLYGMDLESLVTKFGPLPPERAIHVLRQACASLAEAHESDLVHRDVKPANVFVCQYGLDYDFVKVLDFGLVKVEQPFGADISNPSLTAETAIMGSPAYMAPEQITGQHPVGPSSDIYALGCVGYWLLTGRYVFEAQTTVAMALGHVAQHPEPPSAFTGTPIPKELDALILACLAKEPSARPPSMLALAKSLEAIPLASPWTRERAKSWWAEHAPEVTQERHQSTHPSTAA